jgi:DNA adenine methylase
MTHKPKFRPVFRYHGGKNSMATKILQLIPPHKTFVDVFGGAANVILNKPSSKFLDVYNDLNGEVVNFFKVLRNNTDELANQIFLTPYSRDEYQYCRINQYESQCPIERARRFFCVAWQGRGKVEMKGNSGWRRVCNWKSRHSPSVNDWQCVERLYLIADRLRQIQIESKDFRDIILDYDFEDTVFYFDPPYLPDTRRDTSGNGIHKYNLDMSYEDHVELLDIATTIKGKVIISGYDSELYSEKLHRFARHQILQQVDNQAGMATEVIWVSPNIQSTTLFLDHG